MPLPTRTSTDEIDLQQLLLNFILVVRRNFFLILIFFFAGTLLGTVYAFLGPKIYESKMMVVSEFIDDSYVSELGDNLNSLIREKNDSLLAEKLNLSVDQVKQVSMLDIDVIEKKGGPRPEKPANYIAITARVYDQKILPDLQKGIINYLETNEFSKIRVDQKRKNYNEQIAALDKEIESLEAFKTKVHNGEFFDQIKGNVMFDPTEINSKIIELNNDRILAKNMLELVNSIQLLEGFTKYNKPYSPNKAIALAAGSTLGLVFVALLIAFKSMRALVRAAEQSKQ